MILLNPNDVKWIVLHCSASLYGNADIVDKWHRENGWDQIGYHWLVCNCYSTYDEWKYRRPNLAYDGLIQKGRSEQFQGAHVKGHNWETVGVCLIGLAEGGGGFSSRQLESARKLCYEISARFPNALGVKGHYEFTSNKTCPDINLDYFRGYILPNNGADTRPIDIEES